MPAMMEVRKQVVTGVVPPQLEEAMIREAWPSVAAVPAVAGPGKMLTRTIIGAPLAWLLMAPFYPLFKILLHVLLAALLSPISIPRYYFASGKALLPGRSLVKRYTLTNRRLMIQQGLDREPTQQVSLAEIDDVRIQYDANSDFFRAGTLEVLSNGQVVLTLPGVKEPESFRHAILNACQAWAPGRIKIGWVPAAPPAGKK